MVRALLATSRMLRGVPVEVRACRAVPMGAMRGVVSTRAGYAGGKKASGVTYRSIGDHTEVVAVEFNPSVLSYEAHNPLGSQRSTQYMKALFTHGDAQAAAAAASVAAVKRAVGAKPTTVVRPLGTFFTAEDYHQKYYLRGNSTMMAEAGITTDEEVLSGTLAARLCGFIGGHGDAELVEEVAAEYGLPEHMKNSLQKRLPSKPRSQVTMQSATAAAAAAADGGSGGGCIIM